MAAIRRKISNGSRATNKKPPPPGGIEDGPAPAHRLHARLQNRQTTTKRPISSFRQKDWKTTIRPYPKHTRTTTAARLPPLIRSEKFFDDQDDVTNAVVSTQSPYFRPIPVSPNQQFGRPDDRVQFFVRLPNGKVDPNRKIPNLSKIQGKLARLNEAITEGLANQRKQELLLRNRNLETTTEEVKTILWPEPTTERALPNFATTQRSNYLEMLRKRQKKKATTTVESTTDDPLATSSTTTTATTKITTKTTATTTTTSSATTMWSSVETVIEIEPRPKEHPTSHYRPGSEKPTSTSTTTTTTTTTTTKASLPPPVASRVPQGVPPRLKQDPTVRIVRPVYGDYNKTSAGGGNASTAATGEDGVIHDITGTTVYVVGVICVIPAAGLVAWVVRYIMRRKDISMSENCSETGLNCAINAGPGPLGASPGGCAGVGGGNQVGPGTCDEDEDILQVIEIYLPCWYYN
jgi:hypothetical protein